MEEQKEADNGSEMAFSGSRTRPLKKFRIRNMDPTLKLDQVNCMVSFYFVKKVRYGSDKPKMFRSRIHNAGRKSYLLKKTQKGQSGETNEGRSWMFKKDTEARVSKLQLKFYYEGEEKGGLLLHSWSASSLIRHKSS